MQRCFRFFSLCFSLTRGNNNNHSYGRFDHEDWCTHKSVVATWNIDRRQLVANKPDTSIDTQSCLMCVACHPTVPSIIAGGSFSGRLRRIDPLQLAGPGDRFQLQTGPGFWFIDLSDGPCHQNGGRMS